MKVTNNHNLPEVLVRACSNQRKPKDNSISCTELIDSPLIRRLKLRHWDDLEVDVSELVWAMTGTAIHQMVEKHGGDQSEVALSTEFEGWTITGTTDHLTDECITDWKATSVWSWMLSEDWIKKVEQQLNVYRWLYYRQTQKIVPSLSTVIIFRDWRRSEQKRNPDQYPERNIMEVRFQPWALDKVEQFIRERIGFHNDGIYVCSMQERWARPDTFAVKKAGASRATRVYEIYAEAQAHVEREPQLVIEARSGEHLRCTDFCPVRDVCKSRITEDLSI